MARDVKGKIVVVTGAADGLGFAIAGSFLENGANMTIILDINEEKGAAAETSLKKKYGNNRAVFYKCNVVTDLDGIFNKILSLYKKVDVLINNAGISDESNIKGTIEINTIALIEWTMKFYDHMSIDKGGNGGTIINISSIFGYRTIPQAPCYQASKFAVLGFSKSLGHKMNFDKSGVRIVAVCPGWTHTNMTDLSKISDEDVRLHFETNIKDEDWQYPADLGKGTVEAFEKADSGSAWLVEGKRPAEKWDI